MSQHTPGPWRVTGKDGAEIAFSGSAGFTPIAWGNPTPLSAADMRLIAQAPAMLAMLKELLADHANIVECLEDNVMDETCEKARAILRAVEGDR